LKINKLYNISDFNKQLNDFTEIYAVEKMITEKNRGVEKWGHIGYCEVCKTASSFTVDWKNSDGITPNFRESTVCPKCKLNNRCRYMIRLLSAFTDEKSCNQCVIYCYEQVTNFYSVLLEKFISHEVIGSEYFGFNYEPGIVLNGVRHEDALSLSFKDESIDFVISNDVFEHVPDIESALMESFRVLKKEGKLLFSIPFYSNRNETIKRAELANGALNHLLPEQYHANPIANEGSLVFYDIGWDILDKCKQAGFRNSYAIGYHSFMYGYLGGMQLVFCASK